MCLALADGSSWAILAGDEMTSFLVSCLAEVMQLRTLVSRLKRPHHTPGCRVLVSADVHGAARAAGDGLPDVLAAQAPSCLSPDPLQLASCQVLSSKDEHTTICLVGRAEDTDTLVTQLMQLSLVMGRLAQARGALLLHSALAERQGCGVILAGPGGVGKTTASQRLPPPWRSLCDDATLVVRDEQGAYWAHPWPTWSDFMFGGPGGTWDVQHAVPLRGIFFLAQAQEDKVEPFGVGEAVCLLVESAEQASRPMSRGMEENEVRALRLQRFDNVSALAQTVPCYLLRLTQTGGFWHEIERAIAQNSRDAS